MSPTKISTEREEISPKWRHVTCSVLDTPLPQISKKTNTQPKLSHLLQKACCFKTFTVHCRPCAFLISKDAS